MKLNFLIFILSTSAEETLEHLLLSGWPLKWQGDLLQAMQQAHKSLCATFRFSANLNHSFSLASSSSEDEYLPKGPSCCWAPQEWIALLVDCKFALETRCWQRDRRGFFCSSANVFSRFGRAGEEEVEAPRITLPQPPPVHKNIHVDNTRFL